MSDDNFRKPALTEKVHFSSPGTSPMNTGQVHYIMVRGVKVNVMGAKNNRKISILSL